MQIKWLRVTRFNSFRVKSSFRSEVCNKIIIIITDYGHPMKTKIKEILNFGPIWQTKYALAVTKNMGLGFDFRPCSEGNFLTGRP